MSGKILRGSVREMERDAANPDQISCFAPHHATASPPHFSLPQGTVTQSQTLTSVNLEDNEVSTTVFGLSPGDRTVRAPSSGSDGPRCFRTESALSGSGTTVGPRIQKFGIGSPFRIQGVNLQPFFCFCVRSCRPDEQIIERALLLLLVV